MVTPWDGTRMRYTVDGVSICLRLIYLTTPLLSPVTHQPSAAFCRVYVATSSSSSSVSRLIFGIAPWYFGI